MMPGNEKHHKGKWRVRLLILATFAAVLGAEPLYQGISCFLQEVRGPCITPEESFQTQVKMLQYTIEAYQYDRPGPIRPLPDDLSCLLKEMSGYWAYEHWLDDGGRDLLRDGKLVDLWGREMQWRRILYSVGPNGIDKAGRGDDVTADWNSISHRR